MKRIQNKDYPLCLFCHSKNYTRGKWDSFNCYQKWRYHNLPEERKKIIKRIMDNIKKRYKTDKKFREKQMEYNRDWQKRHPNEVRRIARKSKKKRYWEKKLENGRV